ncbi:MAG: hypothetical protein AAFY46_13020, partial [Planctomycetota bacterium]
FFARLQDASGSAGEAIVSQTVAGDTRLVAASGTAFDTGTDLIDLNALNDETMVFGANGQLAFAAETSIGDGIFATDQSGSLIALALPGMEIDIDPNPAVAEIRTIFSVTENISINDRGVVAFAARFTDDQSAIVTVAIPAPATALIPLAGFGWLYRRQRRGGPQHHHAHPAPGPTQNHVEQTLRRR